jgi:two-component system OmpR family sensor kinase
VLNFRQRLVLTHWTVIVVIVACSALAGWWQLSRLVHGQLDAALLTLADTEAGMQVESHGQPVRVHERPPGSAPPSLVRLDRLVQIVNAKGEILARSSNLGDAMRPPRPRCSTNSHQAARRSFRRCRALAKNRCAWCPCPPWQTASPW